LLLVVTLGNEVLALNPDAFGPGKYWTEPRNELEMSRALESFFLPQIAAGGRGY
jgi:hypothetical protein